MASLEDKVGIGFKEDDLFHHQMKSDTDLNGYEQEIADPDSGNSSCLAENVQDDSEELRFKAQRHAEEAASLSVQNAHLVRQCSELQKQLIECFSTIKILDVRCNDAESKLQRTRFTLEDKEKALLNSINKHIVALLRIEEGERELNRVRGEMSNIIRKFMQVSTKQRDLKKELQCYKEMIKERDEKISQLIEERNCISPQDGFKDSARSDVIYEKLNDGSDCESNLKPEIKELQHHFANYEESKSSPRKEQLCARSDRKIVPVCNELLLKQVKNLELKNMMFSSQVDALKKEREFRCSNNILRMTQIIRTIERLDIDISQFLELHCDKNYIVCVECEDNQVNRAGSRERRVLHEMIDTGFEENCKDAHSLFKQSINLLFDDGSPSDGGEGDDEFSRVQASGTDAGAEINKGAEERRCIGYDSEKVINETIQDDMKQREVCDTRLAPLERIYTFENNPRKELITQSPRCQEYGKVSTKTAWNHLESTKNILPDFVADKENLDINQCLIESEIASLEKIKKKLAVYVDSLRESVNNIYCFKYVDQTDRSCSKEELGEIARELSYLANAPLTSISMNDVNELCRICALLQLCIIKLKSIPEKFDHHDICSSVLSVLEDILTTMRSAISSYGSSLSPTSESFEDATCKQMNNTDNISSSPVNITNRSAAVIAPSTFTTAKANLLSDQLTLYQNGNKILKEALMISEEERKRDLQRYKMQLYSLLHKFRLRLKKKSIIVSSWRADSEKDGCWMKEITPRSQHRVCTDLVINLERLLRVSKHNIERMQKQILAKNEETWQLNEQISSLQSNLVAVHDVLDNKKVALGRSEAMEQVLRVSEASLEKRLEQEQRQHEDCRQQLDELATFMHAARCRDNASKPINGVSLDGKALLLKNIVIPPPLPINDQATLRTLVERAQLRRPNVTQRLEECVMNMTENLNQFQRHLEENKHDDSFSQ